MANTPFFRWFLATALVGGLLPLTGGADVQIPNVFSDNMVLQRDTPVVVWGWAGAKEEVTVQIGTEKRETKPNERGEWIAMLPAMKAGGPHVVTISGANKLTFTNVLIGEVWVCSGQSNMEMGIGSCQNGKEEIAAADYPSIRLLMVPNRWTADPQTNIDAKWKVCSPQTVADGGWGGFSAAGYYFGRELHKQLGVPVGLIDATWGGTRIESWTPPEGFAAVPALRDISDTVQLGDPRSEQHRERLEKLVKATEQWITNAKAAMSRRGRVATLPEFPGEFLGPRDLQNPTALYNGMIHPLKPFAIRGAIWYQGESNSTEGMLYYEKMKALIGGWRKVWGTGEFPFLYVQIAPFDYGGAPERLGTFWEAQNESLKIPNTGMAVISDIGNLKDIHPANKQEVGRRLALWALAKTYGQKGVVYSGPVFKSMALEGNALRVTFDETGGGLASRDGQALTWFEIIDADEGGFVKAEARIDGSSVLLTAPEVKKPVAVRFAWSMLAEPNLMNKAGLPASAFRAGTVPKRDLLDMHVPEAKQYQLVYDFDLGKLGPEITYTFDYRDKIKSGFDRVAYFVELQKADGETQYVYVSMDAFTDSLDKIGVPTLKSGAKFQQRVSGLNVFSNVKGIVAGTGLGGGNIEFWPGNYGQANSAQVPKASAQAYDFGDQQSAPDDGYGSMQVHNFEAAQTLFAINHWREGDKADLGIGNAGTGNPDWTFAANAGSWTAKRLRVFVRPK